MDKFLHNLSQCVEFDQWYAVKFEHGSPPARLGYSGNGDQEDDYGEGIYVLDPFYQVYQKREWPSVHRLRDITQPSIAKSSYYKSYLEKWETADEIGYIVPVDDSSCFHFSIARSRKLPYFREHEIRFLSTLVETVGAIFKLHRPADDASAGAIQFQKRIGDAIAVFGQGLLTERESEITLLMLKGYTAATLAPLIGVTHGTAKNHIKSIYRKLGVRSHVDLLVMFIDELYET